MNGEGIVEIVQHRNLDEDVEDLVDSCSLLRMCIDRFNKRCLPKSEGSNKSYTRQEGKGDCVGDDLEESAEEWEGYAQLWGMNLRFLWNTRTFLIQDKGRDGERSAPVLLLCAISQ